MPQGWGDNFPNAIAEEYFKEHHCRALNAENFR